MATYLGVSAYTATSASVAATVDTVVLTQTPGKSVRVTNFNGPNIFFTVGTAGGPNAQPTVNGANCHVAASVNPQGTSVPFSAPVGSVVVNLISGGVSTTYTVESF